VQIARAMEFALKRAEAADEIAEVIIRSLMVDGTPVPRKLARLHLVSDILHNSVSCLVRLLDSSEADGHRRRLCRMFGDIASRSRSGCHRSLPIYRRCIRACWHTRDR
jgi:hypothetical protein